MEEKREKLCTRMIGLGQKKKGVMKVCIVIRSKLNEEIYVKQTPMVGKVGKKVTKEGFSKVQRTKIQAAC